MQSNTLCERLVHCDKDMRDIERCIVGELGGEDHRCSFFRTVEYIRLRIATLYLPVKTAQFATYSDLSVVLTPTEQGPIVAVRRFKNTFNDTNNTNTNTNTNDNNSNNNNDECVLDAMETGMLRSELKLELKLVTPPQKRSRIEFLPV
jgi:hypothetical protein